jgi:hypothetical protein
MRRRAAPRGKLKVLVTIMNSQPDATQMVVVPGKVSASFVL